ncbi:MAG: hypothetical protein Q7J16_09755 [Candidatus Cloacimonadales bacterium]|nr:hypothetical protein [Candidatus Cloacimonadales bacterium]
MFKCKKYLLLIVLMGIALLHSNRTEEKEDINNCNMVIEYNELNRIESMRFFNAEGQEIYSSSFPNILKTPDMLDENSQKTSLWTIFLNSKFRPEESIESAKYYRKAEYKNGIPEGIVKDYFMDGSIQFEGKLLSEFPSVYDGTIRIYGSDGSILSTRTYTKGILEGLYKLFINDKRVSGSSYSGEMEDGVYTKYIQPLNSLVEKFYIKNGKKDSLQYIYDTYGRNIKSITRFKEGKKHGIEQIFDNIGALSIEGNWIEGKRYGLWKYYKYGELSNTEWYLNGKLIEIINLPQTNVFDFILQIFQSDDPIFVQSVSNEEWNIDKYLPALIEFIDSDIDVYKVLPEEISKLPEDLKSTLGNEITWLIEGFWEGVYPPQQISREDIPHYKEEFKDWWEACKGDYIKSK